MNDGIKVEYYNDENFLLKMDDQEFIGKGDSYRNKKNAEPLEVDVKLMLRIRRLQKWAKAEKNQIRIER